MGRVYLILKLMGHTPSLRQLKAGTQVGNEGRNGCRSHREVLLTVLYIEMTCPRLLVLSRVNKLHMKEITQYLSYLVSFTSLNVMTSNFIHFPEDVI